MRTNPNLAGRPDAEYIVHQELERCGIPVIEEDHTRNEVSVKIAGKLGDFHFERAWYYWIVSGKVPLKIAKEIYDNPIGKTDIRAGGDCGCEEPTEDNYFVNSYDKDGKLLLDRRPEEDEMWDKIIEKDPELGEKTRRVDDKIKYTDKIFVENYDIDSELGLYIFVETLKKHNLV
jgi:hypothetical protein